MIQAKCIRIIKDTKGNIKTFVLADSNGNTKEVTPNQLKQDIKEGKINVINLQLKQDKPKENVNKSKVSEKEKIETYIRNAKAFGYKVEEIETDVNRLAYLISKSDTEHILYIPDNVISCTNLLEFMSIKGKLTVIGASNVTNMYGMFSECSRLKSLDFSNFNTSNVTDMQFMFYGCTSLESLDISNFDTSNVTDIGYMFARCGKIESLDLSSFDTSKVINMSHMFQDCISLKYLDLSSFNTSKVTDMECMFRYCDAKVKTKDARIIERYNNR